MSTKTEVKIVCDICKQDITNRIDNWEGGCVFSSSLPFLKGHKGETHICSDCMDQLSDTVQQIRDKWEV